ncbi:MAG: efflux RND transporter periplasmic adaptor subunit [Myxococcota bacterium]
MSYPHRPVRAHHALPALVALLLGSGCGDVEEVPEPIVRPVRYVVASTGDGAAARTFSGTAAAGESSRLSFRVAGRILAVEVDVGDRVEEGQLVARLDDADYDLQVREARANTASARATLRNAEAQYRRTRELYENNNASRSDLDNARAQSESAQMQVASVSQRVQLLERQKAYTRLEAPAAGVISSVDAEVSENVQAGTPIATLQSGDQLQVDIGVPESLIRRVSRGAAATVSFEALGDRSFAGRVFEVGVSTGQNRAAYPVTVRLPEEASADVRPGMAAEVELTFEANEGDATLRLPSSAVGEDRQGRFVFEVERTEPGFGVVHRRGVTIGELTTQGVAVLEGVDDGQLIVSAGVARITDGLRVRVPDDTGGDAAGEEAGGDAAEDRTEGEGEGAEPAQ